MPELGERCEDQEDCICFWTRHFAAESIASGRFYVTQNRVKRWPFNLAPGFA